MPSGYTAPVQDGTITEFADFAINTSRAFGSLVLLRDSDQSLEATKKYIAEGAYLEKNGFYEKSLQEAKERLAEIEGMTDEEVLAAAQKEHDDAVAYNRKTNTKNEEERARYEAMLEKVRAWTPPTEEHVEFKNFMETQLVESIKFDCAHYEIKVPSVSTGWRDQQIATLKQRIESYADEIEKTRKRDEGRLRWVTDLIASLEGENA